MNLTEILDSTLRDGEQTPGVNFNTKDKLEIARRLIEIAGTDSIEIASTQTSPAEYRSAKAVCDWARPLGYLDRIEILCFLNQSSVDWAEEVGCKVINLLAKGSKRHSSVQFNGTPEEHISRASKTARYAIEKGISVNSYLEDWSGGMLNGDYGKPDSYINMMVQSLKGQGVNRIMLADTLGLLVPEEVSEFVGYMVRAFPEVTFDFHGHNDLGCAVENSIAAIMAGVRRVHTTVNGLGERAGNTDLSQIAVRLAKKTVDYRTNINLQSLHKLSILVDVLSGVDVAANAPVIGRNAFTQDCGVHASGDAKGGLYEGLLRPEEVGRVREYGLDKHAGASSVYQNIRKLGLNISLEPQQVSILLGKIKDLADQGFYLDAYDLPILIEDEIGMDVCKVRVLDYKETRVEKGEDPRALVKLRVNGIEYEREGTGKGPFDAFMHAVGGICQSLGKPIPTLRKYRQKSRPGQETESFVETYIVWDDGARYFETIGSSRNQIESEINAAEKMLNRNGF
ncbi:MAG: alpha-isopropylmalate synthase regulatory domain-containing protein [Candidatus Woesearchaeota archaeon]